MALASLLAFGYIVGFGLREGYPAGLPRMLLVALVLFGLEGAGILGAYVLLAGFLGVYRRDRRHP